MSSQMTRHKHYNKSVPSKVCSVCVCLRNIMHCVRIFRDSNMRSEDKLHDVEETIPITKRLQTLFTSLSSNKVHKLKCVVINCYIYCKQSLKIQFLPLHRLLTA
jgi:hypothetical protein